MRELTPIGCRIAGSKERRPVFLGPMSVLEIDGNCPPKIGEEVEEVIWSYLHPDERMQRERLDLVPHPEHGPRRSEALAIVQLLIVSHLVGALDGAFEL